VWPILGIGIVLAAEYAGTWVTSPRRAAMAERIETLETTRAGAVVAQDTELRRIERDLHDGAQARLVALGMSFGMAEQKLAEDPERAGELLAEARIGAEHALRELRDLARGIHPPVLADGRGGVGYLLKDRVLHVADFLEAVHRVAAGGTALDPDVVAQLFSRRRQDGPLERLTPREHEVLALMAEGRSNAGIAESLVLTVGAVEKHVQSILSKLDLPQSAGDHRRVLAVLAYLQESEEVGA
jgi:DNA-binding CsgD family transcriptional regulator